MRKLRLLSSGTMIMLVMLWPAGAIAQKKLTVVSSTDLMGLALPEGSKKDSRGISVSAAGALFTMEAANAVCTPGKAEVYTIPGDRFDLEAFRSAVKAKGFTLDPLPTDDKIHVASGNAKKFMIYFSKEAGWSDLYIAECTMNTGAQTVMPGSSTAGQPKVNPTSGNGTPNSSGLAVQPLPAMGGFQYATSNFDDGWTARIEPDWVAVEKGDAKVYLFFVLPYSSSTFSGTGVIDRDYYWDNYVAAKFSAKGKKYRDEGEFVTALQPKYVEGVGVDPQTGQQRFIAMTLAITTNAAMLTVASYPDEGSFRKQFPRANDKYTSDLAAMERYNKFAIGSRDLQGTWQSGGTQMTQWYDARTGAYAGATLAASSATFTFRDNGQYESIHNGASGAVGAMNSFQQEYKGAYNVANWEVTATNRYQGKTEKFDAHFQAVRGGRLLYLNDNKGGKYLLVKVK